MFIYYGFHLKLRQLEEKLSQYKSNVSDWNFEKGQHVKSFDEKRISSILKTIFLLAIIFNKFF